MVRTADPTRLALHRISWGLLAAGGGLYVTGIAMATHKAIPYLVAAAATVVMLLLFNELNPKRRRRDRMRAGHCPNCAYDLQHDFRTGCSECGWDRP